MTWSLQTAVVLCLIGVAVGAFGTLIGAGGGFGFILTPILLLLYPHDSAQTANSRDKTISRVNPESGASTTISLGQTPGGVVAAYGAVWTTPGEPRS